MQPVHLFTRHKLRAGWGLPHGLLTPPGPADPAASESAGDPWDGGLEWLD